MNQNVRTMGVALSACTVPHAGSPSFDLKDDEIEIGIGIHGEPGRHRIAMEGADGITDRLLEPILGDLGVASGDKVLLFVNGMGGTPLSELYIVYRRAAQVLSDREPPWSAPSSGTTSQHWKCRAAPSRYSGSMTN